MHGGVDAAGAQLEVGVVDVGELAQVAGLEVGLGIVGGRGAALHCQGLAGDVRLALDGIVVAADHQQEAAVVVAVGEVDGLLALFLDGDAGQGQVDVAGLQRGDDAVEIHGLELVLPAQLFGDGRPEVDVEAHVLVALFELEGHEGSVGGDQQFLVGGVGVGGSGNGERSQGCFEQVLHVHASSRSWELALAGAASGVSGSQGSAGARGRRPAGLLLSTARPVSAPLHGDPAFEQDKHAFLINAISICITRLAEFCCKIPPQGHQTGMFTHKRRGESLVFALRRDCKK
ncbi:hypothetical protein D9M71_432450 [compost metagenome]